MKALSRFIAGGSAPSQPSDTLRTPPVDPRTQLDRLADLSAAALREALKWSGVFWAHEDSLFKYTEDTLPPDQFLDLHRWSNRATQVERVCECARRMDLYLQKRLVGE